MAEAATQRDAFATADAAVAGCKAARVVGGIILGGRWRLLLPPGNADRRKQLQRRNSQAANRKTKAAQNSPPAQASGKDFS